MAHLRTLAQTDTWLCTFQERRTTSLSNSLGIRTDNTSPYRGDLKGIVEQHFRIEERKLEPFVPGTLIHPNLQLTCWLTPEMQVVTRYPSNVSETLFARVSY